MRTIYRPQKPKLVREALARLVEYDFPLLNVDLIYGLPGQTAETWLYSLEEALSYAPGEIFIYPLYIRENTILKPGYTGLDHDIRLSLYEVARERLKQAGYVQYSMRRFAKNDDAPGKELLPYSCQEEGMVPVWAAVRAPIRVMSTMPADTVLVQPQRAVLLLIMSPPSVMIWLITALF